MAYEIFISFKNEWQGKPTRDSEIARELYTELKKYNVEVFFSNEEIKRKGRPDYGRLIDSALDSSRVLLLIGTRAEFVKSRWVEYEWDLFNNEICSGRKDGKIITVLEGMDVGELPIGMRRWQSYSGNTVDIVNAAEMAIITLQMLTGLTYNQTHSIGTTTAATMNTQIRRNSPYVNSQASEHYKIAEEYYYGRGDKEKDYDKAFHYYKLSADQGNPKAQFMVGYCYDYGLGVIKEKHKAFLYYKKASEQGHSMAQYNLACCYYTGSGTPINHILAKEWFSKAAQRGNKAAQDVLEQIE